MHMDTVTKSSDTNTRKGLREKYENGLKNFVFI